MARPPSLAKLVCRPQTVVAQPRHDEEEFSDVVSCEPKSNEQNGSQTQLKSECRIKISSEQISSNETPSHLHTTDGDDCTVVVPRLAAASDDRSESEDDDDSSRKAVDTFRAASVDQSIAQDEQTTMVENMKILVEELKIKCQMQER